MIYVHVSLTAMVCRRARSDQNKIAVRIAAGNNPIANSAWRNRRTIFIL